MSTEISNRFWRFITWMFSPLNGMNKDPILFSTSHGHFVKFGLYAGIGAVAAVFLNFFYLSTKGMTLDYGFCLMYIAGAVFMWMMARLAYLIARAKEVVKHPKEYLLDTGLFGQGFYIGGIIFFFFLSWYSGVPVGVLLDAAAYGATVGLAIGRLGCYNYGCCWGKETHQDFGVSYSNQMAKVLRIKPELKNKALYPVQLMDTLVYLMTFVLLNFLLYIDVEDGVVSIVFICAVQGARLWLECYRDDEIVDNKRNWTTVIYAVLLIVFSVSLLRSHDLLGFSYIIDITPPVSFHILPDLYETLTNSVVWVCTLTYGVVIAALFGWHGKKLGSW